MPDYSSALRPRRKRPLTSTKVTAIVIQYPFVVLDGTLIQTERVAGDRPFSSGKHHC
jgi:hypothetical protein